MGEDERGTGTGKGGGEGERGGGAGAGGRGRARGRVRETQRQGARAKYVVRRNEGLEGRVTVFDKRIKMIKIKMIKMTICLNELVRLRAVVQGVIPASHPACYP